MSFRLSLLVFILLLFLCSVKQMYAENIIEQIPLLECLLEEDEEIIYMVKGPFCKDDSLAGVEKYSVLTNRKEKEAYPHGKNKDYISITLRSAYLYIFTKIEGKFSLTYFDRFGDASVKLESRDYNGDGNRELFLLTASGNSYLGFMLDCGEYQMFRRIFVSASSLDDTSKAIAFRDMDGDGLEEILVAHRDWHRKFSPDFSQYDIEIWKWNESEERYLVQRTVPFKEIWGK